MQKNETIPGVPDCAANPVGSLKKMFVDTTMGQRIAAGQCPVRRAVFLKPHGVVKADFIVMPGLEPQYKKGIFKYEQFEAWVRFSSDTVPGVPDLRTTVGCAIKLFNVPGKKLLDPDNDCLTADFLLQNMDVFFVDTAVDMCEFTTAGVVNHDYGAYLKSHPVTSQILDDMQKNVRSCLSTPYWSGLPYAFDERAIKYKLEPIPPPFSVPASQNNKDYLAADLQARLNLGEAQFKFMIQFSNDPVKMPVDRATVRWNEKESVPIQLATLVIRMQDILAQGQVFYGENLSYNPWRTLSEHKPLGTINEARKTVYKTGADLRRHLNGVTPTEPGAARQLANP